MQRLLLWFFLALSVSDLSAQTFLNGDFEINTAIGDQINLTNAVFNSLISNTTGFGTAGNLDIITSSIYSGGPQNGSWYIALTGGGTDMAAMELSSPLVMGSSYSIQYYDKSDAGYPSFPIEIGLSTTNTSFGTLVYTAPVTATNGVWTQRTISFIAPNNGQYLVARMQGVLQSWVNIDNFSFDCSVSVNLGNDTTLCNGDSIVLNAHNPGATYLWQNSTTDSTLVASQAGVYYVLVSDTGCSGIDSIVINVDSIPTVNLGNDTTLCNGASLLLDATTVGNANYLWQDNSTSSTYNASTNGVFWVEVSNSCGISRDSINLTFVNAPVINLGNDTVICNGSSIILDATPSSATNYLWQDNSSLATLQVSQSGLYWVQVSANGCARRDSILVGQLSIPIASLPADTLICSGQPLVLNATQPNVTNYLWQDNAVTPNLQVSQDGLYWVELSNKCGSDRDSINVTYSSLPLPNLGLDTTLCYGFPLVLNAGVPNVEYTWQDFSKNENLITNGAGIFWVEVKNECGSLRDSINVLREECDYNIFIPNAFSPNGDNNNDIFRPILNVASSEYSMKIFNRWGQMIFESQDLATGWNGTYGGDYVEIGTYFYILSFKYGEQRKFYRGDINVIR